MRVVDRDWQAVEREEGELVVPLDPPPPNPRVRVDLATRPVKNARVVVVQPFEFLVDMRALGEPRFGMIDVTDEAIWYGYGRDGRLVPAQHIRRVPAATVWTD